MTAQTIIVRMLQVLAGYLGAVAAAAAAVSLGLSLLTPIQEKFDGLGVTQFFLIAAYFIAMFAALPALAVVLIGEFVPWRCWPPYAIGGALTGLALPIVLFGVSLRGADGITPLIGLASGAFAGFVYWRIAGCQAGAWRRAAPDA